jgi:hypothetical protein
MDGDLRIHNLSFVVWPRSGSYRVAAPYLLLPRFATFCGPLANIDITGFSRKAIKLLYGHIPHHFLIRKIKEGERATDGD